MIIVAYDISNDKLRSKFSKYLKKFGYRLQYSVFKIENSETVLKNIILEIKNRFKKKFSQTDSIIIFELSKTCKQHCFGYAKNEEKDLIIL